MSRKITGKDLWYTPWLIGLVIILMAGLIAADFWLSFSALRNLAGGTGYTAAQAFVWPLTIDAALLMCTLLVFTAELNKWSVGLRRYAYVLLVTLCLLTVAGNALSAGLLTTPMSVNLAVKLFVHLCPPVLYIALCELLRGTFANIVSDNVQTVVTRQKEAARVNRGPRDLTPQEQRQQYIVNAIRAGREIVFTDLGEELNASRQTISKDVNALVTEGVISKNGDGYSLNGGVTYA